MVRRASRTPPKRQKRRATRIGAAAPGFRPIERPEIASHPIWRGHLRLALVTSSVALYIAKHERNAIRFNFINAKTGHRIRAVTLDAETYEEVAVRVGAANR